MQQAILGIEVQKLVFHSRTLAPDIFLENSLSLFFINLSNNIYPCFSIVTQYFLIRLKFRPDTDVYSDVLRKF